MSLNEWSEQIVLAETGEEPSMVAETPDAATPANTIGGAP